MHYTLSSQEGLRELNRIEFDEMIWAGKIMQIRKRDREEEEK